VTQEEFWQLIDKTREESGNNPTKQAELLVKALSVMSDDDIFDYQRIHDSYFQTAFRTDLWDAVEIIYSAGDDGFMDFRAWLIGQGLRVFEQALNNPDSIADLISVENRYDIFAEELLCVAHVAYDPGLEKIIPVYPEYKKLERNSECFSLSGEMQRECLKRHYPKLWAKFGWDAD